MRLPDGLTRERMILTKTTKAVKMMIPTIKGTKAELPKAVIKRRIRMRSESRLWKTSWQK